MWGVCHDDGHFRHGEGGGKEYPNLRLWKEIRAVVVLKVTTFIMVMVILAMVVVVENVQSLAVLASADVPDFDGEVIRRTGGVCVCV
jgi:hypothetical protein